MLITNCYRGATDKLSGFIFDTEMKTYKHFVLNPKEWTYSYVDKNKTIWSKPLPRFSIPGDIEYYFNTKTELDGKLNILKRLHFKEDETMILDFGIFQK